MPRVRAWAPSASLRPTDQRTVPARRATPLRTLLTRATGADVANANVTVTINAGPALSAFRRRTAIGSLGAEVRTRREALNIGVRELARRIELSPSYLCDIEVDRRAPALDTLEALLVALGFVDQRDRWMALAGHIPQDIADALLSSPERWAEVRALLNGGRS